MRRPAFDPSARRRAHADPGLARLLLELAGVVLLGALALAAALVWLVLPPIMLAAALILAVPVALDSGHGLPLRAACGGLSLVLARWSWAWFSRARLDVDAVIDGAGRLPRPFRRE